MDEQIMEGLNSYFMWLAVISGEGYVENIVDYVTEQKAFWILRTQVREEALSTDEL